MSYFIPAIIGGLLVGLASAIYLLFNGRIMGASGIMGALITNKAPGDWKERALFVLGMLVAPLLYGIFYKLPSIEITNNNLKIIAAGLLVGFGARLGSGCTSGHGVCGMGRFSIRSIISVLVFLLAAAITVYVDLHILGA